MAQTLALADIKSCVAKVAPFHNVKKVSLFGSYANGNQTKKSDIDLLVEFENPDIVTLIMVAGLKLKLEKMTKKVVDVIPMPIPDSSILLIEKEVPIYG